MLGRMWCCCLPKQTSCGCENSRNGTPCERDCPKKGKDRRPCCPLVRAAYHCCCCVHESWKASGETMTPCGCVWQWLQLGSTLSVILFLIWLLYRPDRFHPRVDSAVLSALDLAAPPNASDLATLRYDLAVDMSIQNTHRFVSISYLDIGANAFYGDAKLGPAVESLPSFRQGPKNTTVLHPAFRGVATVDSHVAEDLQRDRAAGTVNVKISVALTLMGQAVFKKEVFFYKYDCWLSFPPPRNGAPAVFRSGAGTCLSV